MLWLMVSQMDFAALPPTILHKYLIAWDLVPPMRLLSSHTPPLPASLMIAHARATSPEPSLTNTTPANRPRRDLKDATKRRSSRLAEEERLQDSIAVMADVQGTHQVFATMAERHFQQRTTASVTAKEVEILTGFLQAVNRSRGVYSFLDCFAPLPTWDDYFRPRWLGSCCSFVGRCTCIYVLLCLRARASSAARFKVATGTVVTWAISTI